LIEREEEERKDLLGKELFTLLSRKPKFQQLEPSFEWKVFQRPGGIPRNLKWTVETKVNKFQIFGWS